MPNFAEVLALREDQRRRWQLGESVRVEAYLEQQPALHGDPEAILDLIYSEIVLREEQCDPPQLDEYLQRFPAFATELRVQFEVHQAIQDASQASYSDNTDPDPDALPQSPSEAGATVARYEVLEEIGRGGMGVVYRARQVDLKRLVALKMILAGPHAGAKEQARFRTEAEAIARLQHPNIVQIYEVGEQDGCLFLALELVDGASLEKQFAGRTAPPREAAVLVATLAQAIHAAHQHGIIHRDLKPSNVLLTRDGVPKITDFGLAKMLDGSANATTADGFLGTPCYVAPEQASGHSGEIGPATDVYALGTLLYELLTGEPPFLGSAPMETVLQVLHNEVVPPSQRQAGTPPDLETICLKCLQKAPGRRYTSASDLADDLKRFLANEPIRARPVTTAERGLKWVQRRPTAAALVAVSVAAVLSLAAGLGWHFWDRQFAAEQIHDQERRQVEQAHRKYQQFLQGRDEAQFFGIYGTLFADADASRNLSATETAARKALGLMSVSIEGEGLPAVDVSLSESEQAEVRAGCYQLLLLLAEVAARGPPEQQPADSSQRARTALAILDRAAQLFPATPAYHLRRARYLDLVGDASGARQERAHAATIPPDTAFDYFLLGQEWFQQGKVEQAYAEFQKALVRRPDDFWSQYFLAVGQLKLRRPTEARDGLTRCARQRPEFIWTYLLRSVASEQLAAFDAAEADYQTALDLDANQDARYFLHVCRGRMRLAQRNVAAAMSDFRQAVALKPDAYEAYLELARTFQADRQTDEAARHLEQAIRRRPPPTALAEYHAERGLQLFRDQHFEEALEACRLALKFQPEAAAIHFLQGRILMQLHRYEQAAVAFDDYLTRGGKPLADVYRARGTARMKLGSYLGAVDDYTRGLEVQPDADLYIHCGWAYFFADAWKPALRKFEEALRLDPENGDALVGRGLAQVMLGDYRAAVAAAVAARRHQLDTPEMMHNLACIYALAASQTERDAGNPDAATSADRYREEALDAVRKALALVPAAERSAFWRDKIRPDKALDAIREAAAFRKLAEEYTNASSPP